MNQTQKTLVVLTTVVALAFLSILAASSAITAYNSFSSSKQNVVIFDRSQKERCPCGCTKADCQCCEMCTCKDCHKQHQHGESEKPSGVKFEPKPGSSDAE